MTPTKAQIVVAVMGLAGTVIVGVLANWEKIASPKSQATGTVAPQPSNSQTAGDHAIQIIGSNNIVSPTPPAPLPPPPESPWSGIWQGELKYSNRLDLNRPRPQISGVLRMKLKVSGDSIRGECGHYQLGVITGSAAGTLADDTFSLAEIYKVAPEYTKHTVKYSGTLDPRTETIHGTWVEDPDGDNGQFVVHLLPTAASADDQHLKVGPRDEPTDVQRRQSGSD